MAKMLPVLIGATIASAAFWSCMSGATREAGSTSQDEATQTTRKLEPLPHPAPPLPHAPTPPPAGAPVTTSTEGPTEPADPVTPAVPQIPAIPQRQTLQLSIRSGKDGRFPQAIDLGDTRLLLQGTGLCEWGFLGIDLYRCAFYVERKLASADDALRADQRMIVHLDFVRSLSKDQLSAAWTGSVEVNAKGDPHDHGPALRQLCEAMRDVEDGDSYSFLLAPDEGMRVLHNGEQCARIDDDAFRRLFVKLYLGPNPPTKALRKAMLGDAK